MSHNCVFRTALLCKTSLLKLAEFKVRPALLPVMTFNRILVYYLFRYSSKNKSVYLLNEVSVATSGFVDDDLTLR